MESPDQLEERIRKCEAALGITGLTQPATLTHENIALPVGVVVLTKTLYCPIEYGIWELLDSGNLLGGQVGTVSAWRRTA